jgi:hypothetical protein
MVYIQCRNMIAVEAQIGVWVLDILLFCWQQCCGKRNFSKREVNTEVPIREEISVQHEFSQQMKCRELMGSYDFAALTVRAKVVLRKNGAEPWAIAPIALL